MYGTMSGTKKLTVAAMCIALAFVLNQVSLFRMPQGGSITPASMLFIVLAGYWLGPVYGIIAGVGKGLLDLTTGFVNVHPIQVLLDYPLAFGMLGMAGFFRKMNFGLQIGYIVGVLGRLLMVFTSGLVFFVDVAGLGLVSGAWVSFVYNIAYIGPEMVVTLIIISLPSLRHAIDVVTKGVVTAEDYVAITRRNKASISARARLVTGTVVGALGGLSFVVVSYLTRLENLTVTQHVTDAVVSHIALFRDVVVNMYGSVVSMYGSGTHLGGTVIGNLNDMATNAVLLDAPSRVYRLIERNTGHIAGLQAVGVLFLALGVGLVFSILLDKREGVD